MFQYVVQQILWIISVAAQLLAAMGLGVKWMFMAIRLVAFAVLDIGYFLPNVVRHFTSPNVIRRVSYRSSKRTRQRNLQIFLQKVARIPPARCDEECGDTAASGRCMDPDMDAVELLASTLNPADGRFTMGLPPGLSSPTSPSGVVEDEGMMSRVGSFSGTVEFIRNYYAAAASVADGASGAVEPAGEQKNPDWAPSAAVDPTLTGESEDDEDEEDRKNLHNRATLDIYLPVPLDALFRMMEQERKISSRSRLQRKKFPIVISVVGGAWIVGYSFWNFLLAPLLAARGYVVFCPDYRNFPQTDMEGMVLDISDAVGWVIKNAERYGGDVRDITLIGQSAGAHLTMMSLISQAQVSAHAVFGGTPPSKKAYNVPRYNPRDSIRQYVGLSGIYNICGLVKHFDRRGLYRSVLYQIAGGRSLLPRYSPALYFDERRCGCTGEVLPKNIFDFLPQRMYFIHGDADCSAPVSESANLAFIMRNAQRARLAEQYTNGDQGPGNCQARPVDIEYILVPGANHTDAIIEECLAAKGSYVLDFLCYYTTAEERRDRRFINGNENHAEGIEKDEDEGQIDPTKHPDGVLIAPAPHAKRPLLMRIGSYVCPF
ncbi:putative ecotin [Trypanosoma rangeli]|uniref:Putative ecotin n=1 Tax=Trypanosoma rangeli TaxID=5698 RepID=A0A3R7K197_TRYRA|nr:putative ecotin [Trypanosoma rangeli]RNF00038.1 putative ecotin [Trypanosoma rangeli]|eukprot:RNF00038.1 putative ecotin [Trypanosoma rangeli]